MTNEEPKTIDSLPQTETPENRERRWPAITAFLTAWLLPATTAKRTAHVSLIKAFAVHALTGILTFLLFLILASLNVNRSLPEILFDFIQECVKYPGEATLATLAICFFVELGFLGLAFLVMPWGACDERLRSSWKHALRQTWLHTTHVLPVVLVIMFMGTHYDRLWDKHWNNHQLNFTWPTPPQYPHNAAPDSKEMKEYNEAQQEYQKQSQIVNQQYQEKWEEYQKSRPFIIKYGPVFIGYCGFLAATWMLWALFRAVGIHRQLAPVPRDPMCEFCGYNLIGTASDSRCPECGKWVTESLGDDVRPGSPWDHRHEIGRLRAWWRCSFDAVFRASNSDIRSESIRPCMPVADSWPCTCYRSLLLAGLGSFVA